MEVPHLRNLEQASELGSENGLSNAREMEDRTITNMTISAQRGTVALAFGIRRRELRLPGRLEARRAHDAPCT